MTIKQVIDKVKENDPGADTTALELAFQLADKAHHGQSRKSGEPYIEHCLHTAYVLTQIKADMNTVIAGLLHDVPEDTDYTLDDIKKLFGEDVKNLVEGITKLSKIKYRGVEIYVENLRKMFLAMADDLRVILIKFADRLHNLKTLSVLPEEKQKRIALETMEIYVPIAGLLGVERLKWQMEDICFKILYPEEYDKLQYKYEVEKKAERHKYIQKTKVALSEKLKEAGVQFEITSRFKHLYSIYKKMQQKDRKFDEIYDVFALRVIVPTVEDCYKTLGILHSVWKPMISRFKDYISVPKPNGYRSLHTTVFGLEGKATEFQIRTSEMDEEAAYGIAAHWYYKDKKGANEVQDKKLRWVKEILDIQKNSKDTTEFVKQVKFDVFRNRIFVLTPKGDVYDLPEGSTPIDLAYAVHTEIGNKCSGALINDKMSTLDTKLKNGDLVEIILDKTRKTPNHDWLEFAKTQKAKNKIRQLSKASALERLGSLKKYIPGMR